MPSVSELMRLAIDFENPGREWWGRGGQELWDGLQEGESASAVVVDAHLGRSWLREAARIPGWNDGPEHAPHPICEKSIDEDEEL